MSAPNGICRPSFRVAWGTQHLRQRHLEVGVSCSLKIVLVVRETERGGKREIERQRKERKKGRKKGQNEKNIKEKRTNERRKERQRASWMPHDMVTAGKKAPQVEFLSSVLPIL